MSFPSYPITALIPTGFDAKQYVKDYKIPFKNSERIDILKKVLPFMKHFIEPQTVQTLENLEFISSRALAEIVHLCSQLSQVSDTIAKIQLYMKDSFDDEVKNIAISASKKTANEILQKFGYSSESQEQSEEEEEEDDDDEGMYTEEECEESSEEESEDSE